jgi:type IV pilus assembly protein PilA
MQGLRRDEGLTHGAARQGGVSVVSILGGLAVVGILAAIAMPTYGNYTRRVYLGEGLELAMHAKATATEFYELNKGKPNPPLQVIDLGQETITQYNMPSEVGSWTGKGVQSVQLAGALVIIIYAKTIDPAGQNHFYLVLKPGTTGGSTTWSCLSGLAATAALTDANYSAPYGLGMPETLARSVCQSS